MLKNLIKISIRIIKGDLLYSLLNILGLTIGFTSSLFLLLHIFDELSYEKFHENSENIYRVVSRITEPDDQFDWAVAQIPFTPQVKEDYPEVSEAVRFIPNGATLFINGDIRFYEEDFYYADPEIFKVFTFPFIEGNPETALIEPNTIVVTRSFANRYFKDENPMDKTIEDENGQSFKITGLVEDVPHNTHLRFSAVASRSTLPEEMGSWGNFGVFSYILLPDGYDKTELEKKLPEMYEKYMAEIFERIGINIEYKLQPLTKIHLFNEYQDDSETAGDIKYVYIFGIIAAFILVIASINYMNLTTSRGTKRAREVGLRKVVGSNRRMLITQFLTESVIFTIISLLLSIILIILLLPEFNQLSGKFFSADVLTQLPVILSIAGIIILVGIIGGIYPAFYLSGFKPVEVLKGDIVSGISRISIRKILVIIQFSISLAMIISTWVVYDQLGFLKNKDIGFDHENILSIQLSTREMAGKSSVLKEKLLSIPAISSVGSTSSPMGQGSPKIIMRMETPEGMIERGINFVTCDHDFVETLDISILEGRDFTEEIKADTALGVVINETLAKRMNWENPIGKKVQIGGEEQTPARVVGLMKDYHQTGMYNPVESLMFLYRVNNRRLYAKIEGEEISEVIAAAENKWNEIFPEIPFRYTFLEDDFNNQFEADERRGIIFTLFSILTIIIACLGLYGLASYTVEQRTPEIGIRKVLGASINNIFILISKEFMILIGIAILIAFPVSYYFMTDFLQDYTYKAPLKITTFVLSALVTIIIALITVGYHTYRAGKANPVNAIRNE